MKDLKCEMCTLAWLNFIYRPRNSGHIIFKTKCTFITVIKMKEIISSVGPFYVIYKKRDESFTYLNFFAEMCSCAQ